MNNPKDMDISESISLLPNWKGPLMDPVSSTRPTMMPTATGIMDTNEPLCKKIKFDEDDDDDDEDEEQTEAINRLADMLEDDENESEMSTPLNKEPETLKPGPIIPEPFIQARNEIVETKVRSVEPEEDPDDISSPTTTTAQSSSDPEQTPRSSNDCDGYGDKCESESTKSGVIEVPGPEPNNISQIHFSAPSLTKRSVTLQMLLAAGILKPGESTMSLEYHGQKFVGDLLENGQIRSQETGLVFSSPSAWAIACKEIINPEKIRGKSGCGWASIKYKSLKLDYYKAVWFKRLREGSIDIKSISNGAAGTSSDTSDEDEAPHLIVKYGEHFDGNPRVLGAKEQGAKVLISTTEFKDMERIQPFHVKISSEALLLADFHSNLTSSETVGYISGQWNGDQNTLVLSTSHPCNLLLPHATSVECDNERNRIANQIQKLGHEVVGWYHSHPRTPPYPSRDDITRQLDYQVMMKGSSEASYIPCVGLIVSPNCYADQDSPSASNIKLFWVLPPPENRPLELGRPMNLEYEVLKNKTLDIDTLVTNMALISNFYSKKKEFTDMLDSESLKFDRLKESLSPYLGELGPDHEFWLKLKEVIKDPTPFVPPEEEEKLNSDTDTGNTEDKETPEDEVQTEKNSGPEEDMETNDNDGEAE